MPRKARKKSDPNLSPVGWYIGSIVLRFKELRRSRPTPKPRRELVWENTILIKARNLRHAYDKLITEGKLHTSPYTNTDGVRVRFKFEGIGFLLPIYDRFEDLSELIWTDHGNIHQSKVRKLVKTKRQLLALRKAS